jgi:aryl-alcohol dehydrogenase-like predicted oxidoreductase
MQKRKLGAQGLEVSALGLGCMGMSFAYGKADEKECLKTLHRSLELGINFWDTAESYGPLKNEELLGKALQGKRSQVVIATKFAWKEGKASLENLDGSPQNARRAVEGSLSRLQTDFIDLLYLHRVDPKIPIEETVGGMSRLVKEGKVKYIGLSEVGPNTLRRAHKVHPLSALQSEYSLWETSLDEKIIPVLRELKIGLVPFSPVGRGFLTGTIKRYEDLPEGDMRRNLPRFQGGNFSANIRLVDEVKKIGAKRNATPSQVALAWLLRKGSDVTPIPGTTRVNHLEENAEAVSLSLSEADFTEVNRILSSFKVQGDRHGEMMGKMVNKD